MSAKTTTSVETDGHKVTLVIEVKEGETLSGNEIYQAGEQAKRLVSGELGEHFKTPDKKPGE